MEKQLPGLLLQVYQEPLGEYRTCQQNETKNERQKSKINTLVKTKCAGETSLYEERRNSKYIRFVAIYARNDINPEAIFISTTILFK